MWCIIIIIIIINFQNDYIPLHVSFGMILDESKHVAGSTIYIYTS